MTHSTGSNALPSDLPLLPLSELLNAQLPAEVDLELSLGGDQVRVVLRSQDPQGLPSPEAIAAVLQGWDAQQQGVGPTVTVEAWSLGQSEPLWTQTFERSESPETSSPETSSPETSSRWRSLGQVTQGVRSGLGGALGQTAKMAGTVGGTVGKAAGSVASQTGKVVGGAVGQASKIVGSGGDLIENTTENLGNLAKAASETVSGVVSDTVTTVATTVGETSSAAADAITQTATEWVGQAGEAIATVTETLVQGAETASQTMESIAEVAKTAPGQGVGNVVAETTKTVGNAVVSTGKTVGSAATQAGKVVGSAASKTTKTVGEAGKTVGSAVTEAVTGVVKTTAAVPQGMLGLPSRMKQTQTALKAGGAVAILAVLAIFFTAIAMIFVLIKLGSL